MTRESWKVFLACALGAGIGSLVALELNQWLWWLGLIAGGLAGYLAYEFKKVLLAIPAAWRAVVHPNFSLKMFGWGVAVWISITFLTALFLMMLIMLTLTISKEDCFWASVIFSIAIGSLGTLILGDESRGLTQEERITQMRKIIYAVFPPIFLGWHLPRGCIWFIHRLSYGLFWLICQSPRFAVACVRVGWTCLCFFRRFGWQVFIRIHSEMRLLCMADAALGAAVGYFIGSAIIGALAGGVFGLINYAVVTKRILEPRGLLPAR